MTAFKTPEGAKQCHFIKCVIYFTAVTAIVTYCLVYSSQKLRIAIGREKSVSVYFL